MHFSPFHLKRALDGDVEIIETAKNETETKTLVEELKRRIDYSIEKYYDSVISELSEIQRKIAELEESKRLLEKRNNVNNIPIHENGIGSR